jgi:hypothetical protein
LAKASIQSFAIKQEEQAWDLEELFGEKRPRGGKLDVRIINLRGSTQSTIQANKELQTQMARDGRNGDKIQERWSSRGRCSCTSKGKKLDPPCHRHVALSDVVELSRTLWSITSDERAVLLSSLYSDAAGTPQRHVDGELKRTRVNWYIGTHKVCRTSFAFLVHMSPDTINAMCGLLLPVTSKLATRYKQHPELRGKRGPKLPGFQTACIDRFFEQTWESAGVTQYPQ